MIVYCSYVFRLHMLILRKLIVAIENAGWSLLQIQNSSSVQRVGIINNLDLFWISNLSSEEQKFNSLRNRFHELSNRSISDKLSLIRISLYSSFAGLILVAVGADPICR